MSGRLPASGEGLAPGWATQFASDNTAGVCPEAMSALQGADAGWLPSYGNDEITRQVCDRMRALFETDCDVYFVFNGTAANSLALSAMCQSYHSVICADSAHVETDECGAPEFFSNGTKLLKAHTDEGRLRVDELERLVRQRTDIHYPRPRAVSVTQATELGTVYRPEQIAEIATRAHDLGLGVHMDGARFANAVASLECAPADVTWRAGVDVLCFGGTKMGLPVGEAVVFFDRGLSAEFAWRCKQAGQLASKMRYLSAPWLGMLDDGAWLRRAGHANRMARRLADRLGCLPDVTAHVPCEANGVFVHLPADCANQLREDGVGFYTFIGGAARFMCSWATTEAAVDALAAHIEHTLQNPRTCE
ncbi:MAG: low specificity L-threonine aldolase [Rhodocyclaceae bacterium]|nr:low specificity L-threonine aldolase [Rhodocyclaceae bacterium]